MNTYPKYPVDHVGITQYYKAGHPALDLGWKTPNPPIYAAADGVVVACGTEAGTGALFVVLKHPGLMDGKNVFTRYWHLASFCVNSGQPVKMGEKIGIMGNTGNSRGVHLHFEFWITPTAYSVPIGGDRAVYAVNPADYVYLYPGQTQSADNSAGVVKALPAGVDPETGKNPEQEKKEPAAMAAGAKIELVKVNLYSSSTIAQSSGTLTGVYYLWETPTGRGRVRITNAPERVGVAGQVTGWIDEADLSEAAASGGGKTVEEIAREVVAGKWGNGAERKEKLTAAGYDYSAVQDRVNKILR